jgi:periplasmic protein TonB
VFHTLLETEHAGNRIAGSSALSVATHAALVGLAVIATARHQVPEAMVEDVQREIVYRVRSEPRRQPPAPAAVAAPAIANRVIRELRLIALPTIPAVSPEPVTTTSFLPESRIAAGIPSAAPPAAPTNGIYTFDLVDQAVVPFDGNAQPQFPSRLRSAGVEGSVLVRFVVDSVGRVEARSVEIVRETHPLFGEAVRRWITRTRYRPARVARQPVRQLVEQRVEFNLER